MQTVSKTQPQILYPKANNNVEQTLRQAYIANEAKTRLIICVLPTTNADLYQEIKRIGDTVIGVVTQCMQKKFISFQNPQYLANLCLKINVKLGGSNNMLAPNEIPFLNHTTHTTIIM